MSDSAEPGPRNRLAREKSPYLLQHAANPVDWFPWGPEAFAEARRRDVPVFLSIGYAACHWCHVMAHESFEDKEIARVVNRGFVAVKVDREERPDVDHLYMNVCQALTGRGGWPLSAFLTPDGLPFFAGTYFPPRSRFGATGFFELLGNVSVLWRDDRPRVLASAGRIADAFGSDAAGPPAPVTSAVLQKCRADLAAAYDAERGGFGGAPKFPTPHQLSFLIGRHRANPDPAALSMATATLSAMKNGGIRDQLAGGYHRYSVDAAWLVPHFEKMLYDQAGIAEAFMDAYEATGEPAYADEAGSILSWVMTDLSSPEGAFLTALDADSEGREGLFYTWTPGEIIDALGPADGILACRFYGVTDKGNMEDGRSVLSIPLTPAEFAGREGLDPAGFAPRLEEWRKKLLAARNRRPRPALDDKVLAGQNGLMVAALARASKVLSEPGYLAAARRAAAFIEKTLTDATGRLLRRFRDGDAAVPAFLEDYAFVTRGMIAIHEASGDPESLSRALFLQAETLRIFGEPDGSGALFFTGLGNEPLFARTRDAYDGALPSGNSAAAANAAALFRLTGDAAHRERALSIAGRFGSEIAAHPTGFSAMLSAVAPLLGGDWRSDPCDGAS